jgi:biopolymer transport protein ExbD
MTAGTEIMHKLIPRGVAVLTFCLGLAVSLVISNFIPPPDHNSRLVAILTPARERNPIFNPNEQPFASTDFLNVQQSVMSPSIADPIFEHPPESDLIEHNCRTLALFIDSEGNLTLNTSKVGSLNNTTELTNTLKGVFQQRVRWQVFRRGMESRTDLPMIERIPRTLLIRASRSLSYGDVLKVIEVLKETRANPIALQIQN